MGLLLCAAALISGQEDLIKVETAGSLRVARGQEGKLTLNISVKPGVTVNSQPSFIVEFSPSEDLVFPKNFFTASDLNIEVVEENGKERLNLNKPVEIPFSVSKKAQRGLHVLKGRVKYFATPLKEGWCKKSAASFSARILVTVNLS